MAAEDALGRQFGAFKPLPEMTRSSIGQVNEYPLQGRGQRGRSDRLKASTRLMGAGRGWDMATDLTRKGITLSQN